MMIPIVQIKLKMQNVIASIAITPRACVRFTVSISRQVSVVVVVVVLLLVVMMMAILLWPKVVRMWACSPEQVSIEILRASENLPTNAVHVFETKNC